MNFIKIPNVLLMMMLLIGINSCSDDTTSPSKSSEKKILTFVFQELSPPVVGVVNENTKTITANVPKGTNITNLVPTITFSAKANINPQNGIAQNFSSPVKYKITAEDESTVEYNVVVTVDGGTTDIETLKGNISENRTLKDLGLPIDYIIEGVLYIEGNALVTIEPGVTISFASTNSGLDVGQNAGFRAVGTTDKHIVLIGPLNNQNPGSYSHIIIRSNRADNIMEYVDIINGGSSDDDGVLRLYDESKMKMRHCTIDQSLGYGIYCYSDAILTEFIGNTIKNCAKEPIFSDKLQSVISIDGSNNFFNNGKNQIYINYSSTIENEATLNTLTIPWFLRGGYNISNVFNIQPGCVIVFNLHTALYCIDAGTLVAKGTAAKPIRFIGAKNDAGYWLGIEIKSKWSNILEYCEIDGAGSESDWASVYVDDEAHVTLNYNKISNSGAYGVSRKDKDNPYVKGVGNTFTNCALGNVQNRNTDTEPTSDNL